MRRDRSKLRRNPICLKANDSTEVDGSLRRGPRQPNPFLTPFFSQPPPPFRSDQHPPLPPRLPGPPRPPTRRTPFGTTIPRPTSSEPGRFSFEARWTPCTDRVPPPPPRSRSSCTWPSDRATPAHPAGHRGPTSLKQALMKNW